MKLLIVDDSKLMQRSIAKIMTNLLPNIELSYAANGEEGLKLFRDLQPDIVTIDLLMPVMSGLELLKLINEHEHKAKIFVLSADVQKVVQDEVIELGAKFISKPFTEEKAIELLGIIKE